MQFEESAAVPLAAAGRVFSAVVFCAHAVPLVLDTFVSACDRRGAEEQEAATVHGGK
jgi:hypothetical protein